MAGHGLLAHMLDVAAVAEVLQTREPEKSRQWTSEVFDLPLVSVSRCLSAFVGLHDFGKAIPGFQCKWPEGQLLVHAAGLPFKTHSLSTDRHDLAGSALLRRLLAEKFGGASWIRGIVQAIGAHHGYMPSATQIRDAAPRFEGDEWRLARQELFEAYWTTLEPEAGPADHELQLPAIAWLAGLTSVADWIGSNQEWFPIGERDESIKGHFQEAKLLADKALNEIGWPGFRVLLGEADETAVILSQFLANKEIKPRPLQVKADQLIKKASGPVLLLVEAPMGEGKTEMAFIAHLRLQAANGHRGLYVALPTQATGNAMYQRASAFINAFSPDDLLDMQLVHGNARLAKPTLRLKDVNGSKQESISCSAWFSQKKRPLLSPYGVGTIDQALYATLNVKHHFVRLWGLANRVIVLDEVHAYDTYTSGLIEALLRWLKALNCSVVLMSATLPDKKRLAFLKAWNINEEPDIEYPRILMCNNDGVLGTHVECREMAPINIFGISENLSDIAASVVEKLVNGGCGAVIVNTVQRAQDLYTLLKSLIDPDTELMLFHARFPADERSVLEQKVLTTFGCGKNSKRPLRALLVATQVVEQSLDIDFDFLFSDLAPIDLILQRAGRLHRHLRKRPEAHKRPALIVAGFQRDQLPELKETGWGYVYDPYILYRTWGIAGKESLWNFPDDIDRLVQAVYSDEPFEEEDREGFINKLDGALAEHLATLQDLRQRSLNVALDAEAEPQYAYTQKPNAVEEGEGQGLKVVTRLGQETITVIPVRVYPDGWRIFPEDQPFNPEDLLDDELASRLFQRQIRISRKQILAELVKQPTPKCFEQHPLLRNLYPIQLNGDMAEFGKLKLRLDLELGMIYEKSEEQ